MVENEGELSRLKMSEEDEDEDGGLREKPGGKRKEGGKIANLLLLSYSRQTSHFLMGMDIGLNADRGDKICVR